MVENDDWNLIQKLYRSTGTRRLVCSHLYRTVEANCGTRAQLRFCEYGMAVTFIYSKIDSHLTRAAVPEKERERER
jgi:hypothetical protein